MMMRGFTLLEVLIVTVILAGVMLIVTIVMSSTTRELSVSVPESEVRIVALQAIERMVEELGQASASQTTVGRRGLTEAYVSFAVPVALDASWGIAGNPSPDWQARYGARLAGAETAGGLNVIRFVQSAELRESSVSGRPLNINENTETPNDTADVFSLGRLELVYDPNGLYPTAGTDGDERMLRLTGDIVILAKDATGAVGADIDGDGTADPLFVHVPGTSKLDLNLWCLRVVRAENTALLANQRVSVVLANQ